MTTLLLFTTIDKKEILFMDITTSEEFFKQLKDERLDYEKKAREHSLNSNEELNMFCIEQERKYMPNAFGVSVKIFNNLETDKAKEAFSQKVVSLFGELGRDKSQSVLSHYNECKNVFNAIRGALLAKHEGKNFKQIDELLGDTYKFMKVPFVKNEDNGFNHLRNEVLDVVSPELKKTIETNPEC